MFPLLPRHAHCHFPACRSANSQPCTACDLPCEMVLRFPGSSQSFVSRAKWFCVSRTRSVFVPMRMFRAFNIVPAVAGSTPTSSARLHNLMSPIFCPATFDIPMFANDRQSISSHPPSCRPPEGILRRSEFAFCQTAKYAWFSALKPPHHAPARRELRYNGNSCPAGRLWKRRPPAAYT